MNFSTFFLKAKDFFHLQYLVVRATHEKGIKSVCVLSLQLDRFISMTTDFVKRVVKLHHTSFNNIFLWKISCVI